MDRVIDALRRRIAIACLALAFSFAGAREVPAQTNATPGTAMTEAATHRFLYLDQSLPIDKCSVRHLVAPAEEERAWREIARLQPNKDNTQSCAPLDPSSGGFRIEGVRFDSVTFDPKGTEVFATVLRGGYLHREQYHLLPRGTSGGLAVVSVRLYDHSHFDVRPTEIEQRP